MFGRIITFLFYAMIAGWLLRGIISLIRANLYDVRQIKWRRKILAHPNARHLRGRPLISVIVFSDNDEATIVACLKSLLASSYRKLEVIIVDNASGDGTKKLVREFIKDNPKKSLRLVAKRQAGARDWALAGANKWINGELVMVLDASSLVDKQALKNSFLRLADTKADVVLMNVRLEHDYRLFGLAGKLRAAATIWVKKTTGRIGATQDSYNYAAMYRRDLWEELIHFPGPALTDINLLRNAGPAYDSQSVAHSYKSSQSRLNPQTFTELLIAGFMIYIAFKFNNPNYILLAWLSFTLLLILAVWSDESLDWRAKTGNSLLAVMAYSLYIFQSLLELARLAGIKLRRYYGAPSSGQFLFPLRLLNN